MLRLTKNVLQRPQKAICFLSGGVDSAVSAAIMKKYFNFSIQPVYVKNWVQDENSLNEQDSDCQYKQDLRLVNKVVQDLEITKPLIILDTSNEYYNQVFMLLLDSFNTGGSLNVDVLCNQHIKFKAWIDKLNQIYPETKNIKIITGHYAKNSGYLVEFDKFLDDSPKLTQKSEKHSNLLMQATDKNKCQTLFLSKMPRDILKNVIFPVGDLNKNMVKVLATRFGLEYLRSLMSRKESMGICFIGKKSNFGDFLGSFLPEENTKFQGKMYDLITQQFLGYHAGIHNFTLGQRPKNKHLKFETPNLREKLYIPQNSNQSREFKGINCVVGGIDNRLNTVYLTGNTENKYSHVINPVALSCYCILDQFETFVPLEQLEKLNLQQKLLCQFMNRHFPIKCSLSLFNHKNYGENPFKSQSQTKSANKIILKLANMSRWITPDQYFVIYDDQEQVVAAGKNLQTGPSLYEMDRCKVKSQNQIFANHNQNVWLPHRSQEYINFWSEILTRDQDSLPVDNPFEDQNINQIKYGFEHYFEPR